MRIVLIIIVRLKLVLRNRYMYVCICNAITDKQVLQAQKNGFHSIDEITQLLGVGNGCGRCLEKAEDLLIENAGVQQFNPKHYIAELNPKV